MNGHKYLYHNKADSKPCRLLIGRWIAQVKVCPNGTAVAKKQNVSSMFRTLVTATLLQTTFSAAEHGLS